jgi:hypothetical protein
MNKSHPMIYPSGMRRKYSLTCGLSDCTPQLIYANVLGSRDDRMSTAKRNFLWFRLLAVQSLPGAAEYHEDGSSPGCLPGGRATNSRSS